MRLAFHWFYFKSRSFPLVYVGAISDSYNIFVYLDASQKLLRNWLLCVKTIQTPCFLDLRACAGFCGRFADFCRIFAGRFGRLLFFLLFADSVQKCFEQEKVGRVAESDPHTQPQCTTVQPQEMLLTSAEEGNNMLKHSCFFSNFDGFWAFPFLMTIPKKLGDFDHNW